MKMITGPRRRSPAPRARPRRTDLACTSEWQCPACAQAVALPERLARHIFRCAPELAMSTSPQWSAARAVIGEADEEESADAARRHEATWKSLNQRRKKAGPLSDRERAQALEALAFATRREATILKAASHIGFHAIHDTDGASKDGVEQDSNEAENSHVVFSPLIAPSVLEDVKEIDLVARALNTPIPLAERAAAVSSALGVPSKRAMGLLRKKKKRKEKSEGARGEDGRGAMFEQDLTRRKDQTRMWKDE